MADAIISIVAARVTAIIENQIHYEFNLVRDVEKEVLNLSEKLNTIRNVLDDAEKRGVQEQSVKHWLKNLEDAAYEMDDILDEWIYAFLKFKQKVCCSLIPSSCLCLKKIDVRHDIAKKIKNVKATVARVLKEKDEFNFVMSLPLTDSSPNSWRVQSTSSIELEKVYGRDVDRDNIVRKLTCNGDSQILSIVGMGGIGKTTLAQLVYNDSRVKDCFELRIWVCVSDPFDVAGIARAIVGSMGKESPPNTNQLEVLLQKLRDYISGRKFFLVLDDVWTEDYNKWEPLKINLDYGAPGSKILVTTRNRSVAKMMGTFDNEIHCPQQLTDEECWSLFRRVSLFGRSEEECRIFEDVGRKIASKCKGLPLAANVLGSLLQFKSSLEEWENVLESEIWRLEKAELDLFPHLLLSYNELSPTLKRCFSYCAIYPKDSRIDVESLIEKWMALGYLGFNIGNSRVEFKGREYFNNLATRSLFQDFEKCDSGEQIIWCKMHDIVHDFARFLRKNDRMEARMTKRTCKVCNPFLSSRVKEYRSLFWGQETPPNICDCLTSLRVLELESIFNGTPPGMEKLIHLRWLDMSGTILSKEDLKTICKLYFLKTLLLASCSLKEIPEEIGNLFHLRHLHLSSNQELKALPKSLCSLLELQTLDIRDCINLFVLPEGLDRLENLKHLVSRDTPVSCRFPQGLAKLSGLRTLSEFHGGRDCNKLGLLKNLNRLSGTLILQVKFSSSSDLEELVEGAREAELRNKIHLQTLLIKFVNEMNEKDLAPSLQMDIIDALEPNPKLTFLVILGYKGSRLPHWFSSPLNLVRKIELIGFSEVLSLPAMGKLPFLESLRMEGLNELKLVGTELLGIRGGEGDVMDIHSSSSSTNVAVAFPKLKELIFWDCSKWEDWEDITAEEEQSAAVMVLPCLTRLYIRSCGGLKKLPHRLLRKAESLQMLDITYSSELHKCYGDKDGSPWRSISQINPQLRLQIFPIIVLYVTPVRVVALASGLYVLTHLRFRSKMLSAASNFLRRLTSKTDSLL